MIDSPRPSPPVPEDLERRTAREILQLALTALGETRVAVAAAFSAEDMVLLGLLSELNARPRVFTIDTGRLPSETFDVMARAQAHFGIEIEIYEPDEASVRDMTDQRGVNLFYRSADDRRLCCAVRRVEPLGRALAATAGWITGLRRDQTATRAGTPKIGLDPAHGGMWKIAPLADWAYDDVWRYIAEHRLPYSRLYDRGYTSIGCDPCTRAVSADADPRSGRWWWEEDSERECGMHLEKRAN